MEYTGMDIHEHQLYEYDVISRHSNSSALGVITFKNGMWYVTWNQTCLSSVTDIAIVASADTEDLLLAAGF